MRILSVALCLVFGSPAVADDESYDALFRSLASAGSAEEASLLSDQIWARWMQAPDPEAQALLDEAMGHRAAGNLLEMLAVLDTLTAAYPDYAEGWNQRATLYFIVGDYERSLADVANVLALEPRHFGALSGRAVILLRQGHVALAQIAIREALQYHPYLNERAILDIPVGSEL